MLFVTILKGVISLISFVSYLSIDYRKATDLFQLTFYPVSFLELFISCWNSLLEFLGYFMYTIISCANSDSLAFSFPILIPLPPFLVQLLQIEPKFTILNRQVERRQSCLVPDFSGIASSFSPFSVMLATGLLYIAFTMFRYGPGIPVPSKTFSKKG